MEKRNLYMVGGAMVLGLALIALPSVPARSQESEQAKLAQMQEKLAAMQQQAADRLAAAQERLAELAQDREMRAAMQAAYRQEQEQERLTEPTQLPDGDGPVVLFGDEGGSWLGVELKEVNTETVQKDKLPAERGVVLGSVVPDSPAAKAGLKENDVITEVNGQRVEGTTEFRRMIHEIPAGRAAQFTVWRDGRAQTISVTLGKSEDRGNVWYRSAPRVFNFELPRVEIPKVRPMPEMEWGYGMLGGPRPRLGIDAEDLNGQLGEYFGAPDGEGVLVRDVNPGSGAEKAGLKSGDVITSLDGERIHSLGDLREKLADKKDGKSVKLEVLRNKSEISITVELPAPPKPEHVLSHRTEI
ncbi:MAG TPA: PDZ domain-containing protein [Candidatus Acidoferrum sp.]|nr:PDZ domain-containing protein [Candidatus Acidoferrum sp.]